MVVEKHITQLCLPYRAFLGMFEKGEIYPDTLFDASLNFSNLSTSSRCQLQASHHPKRRLSNVISDIQGEYANQVGDISSTTGSSRQNFAESVNFQLGLSSSSGCSSTLNLNSASGFLDGTSSSLSSYNGNHSSPKVSSNTLQQSAFTIIPTSNQNQQNVIRASTIKLLDTYQVCIFA